MSYRGPRDPQGRDVGGKALSRRSATSQKSEVGGAPGGMPIGDGESAVRSDGDGSPQASSIRARKPSGEKGGAKRSGKDGGGQGSAGDVGQLLRGAYRQAVDEAVPDDLMDLLNRLE